MEVVVVVVVGLPFLTKSLSAIVACHAYLIGIL